MQDDKVYIVISQTGTVLSRILKRVTGAPYNHSSISPYADLRLMYSFGRRHPYNPFWGGFVTESVRFGTFKRFRKTKVVVLGLSVTAEQYHELCRTLEGMARNRGRYRYNYLGVCLAAFRIARRKKDCYYCSEFVKLLLERCALVEKGVLPAITQPIHFADLPRAELIFRGVLHDYAI